MDVMRIYLARVLAAPPSCAWRVSGRAGSGRADHWRIVDGQKRAGAGLISRGHGPGGGRRRRAYRIGPETLEGRCPDVLRDFSGSARLGHFEHPGDFLAKPPCARKVLADHPSGQGHRSVHARTGPPGTSRAKPHPRRRHPQSHLPGGRTSGRNLAVLVEAAVRNYILHLRGIDSTRQIHRTQTRFLREQERYAADPD